jgi:CheY-like chemotaxis protein
VLVVDAEHDARLVLAHYLREMGCTVLTAGTGQEALEIARRERPDLVTLDLRMPDLHGAEILRRLKADPDTREIPVVVVSVDAYEGRGRLVGALDLLPKPVERDDLLRVVWRVLVRRGTTRVLVVQEHAEGRARIVAALAEVGLDVQGVAGPDAVTQALATDAPDAVVLDLGDPDGDGFPVLERLREHPYHGGLPVVVVADRELTPAEGEELDDKASSVLRRSDSLEGDLVRTLGTFLPLPRPDPVATPAEASAGSPSP